MKKERHDLLVTLMHFASAPEANIYKTALEAGGVEAALVGEMAQDVLPIAPITGGIRLQVRAADEKRARELLGILPEEGK